MKYLQITVVVLAFILLVAIKSLLGSGDNQPQIQAPTNLSNPQTSNNSSSGTSTAGSSTPPTSAPSQFKNGTYTGSVEDAFYGNIQVQAVISGGKLTDVVFLQYPNDNRTSISINTQASVYLRQEAITAQSANVDIISGASDSSMAFQRSMATALRQAQ